MAGFGFTHKEGGTDMKAYTDIFQSEKLAEILPLESADMCFVNDGTAIKIDANSYEIAIQLWGKFFVEIIPCWSLAALLSILPIVYINNKKEVCGPLHIDITDSETPFVLWYVNILHKGNIVEIQTQEYDNMIDACYEMIINLHELKLL